MRGFGSTLALELTADPELVEQVILNVLLSAVQAMEGQSDASIIVTARLDARSRVAIQVADNGPGIVQDAQEKLFVAFFTTKKDGSGIGLSLSRQIMRLHGGTIRVHSIPHVETVVTLRFQTIPSHRRTLLTDENHTPRFSPNQLHALFPTLSAGGHQVVTLPDTFLWAIFAPCPATSCRTM